MTNDMIDLIDQVRVGLPTDQASDLADLLVKNVDKLFQSAEESKGSFLKVQTGLDQVGLSHNALGIHRSMS